MARILALTSGPDDWQPFLARKEHWRTGYSARTLAHCWEAADGFPREVRQIFAACKDPLLEDLEPLLAVPEFKVPLPGGARPSQNDIFVLARSSRGPVSLMVEGKVSESFGPTLDKWRAGSSEGKEERLSFLLRSLGLSQAPQGHIRYQLIHRAASAVITGDQYHAVASVLLVHSFSEARAGWADYQEFCRLFGVDAAAGTVQRLESASTVPLFGAWVDGDRSYLKS